MEKGEQVSGCLPVGPEEEVVAADIPKGWTTAAEEETQDKGLQCSFINLEVETGVLGKRGGAV